MKVLRAESFAPLYSMIEPYCSETFASVSASNLKFKPSLAQNSLCDSALSTLTPSMTAFAASYFSRSR